MGRGVREREAGTVCQGKSRALRSQCEERRPCETIKRGICLETDCHPIRRIAVRRHRPAVETVTLLRSRATPTDLRRERLIDIFRRGSFARRIVTHEPRVSGNCCALPSFLLSSDVSTLQRRALERERQREYSISRRSAFEILMREASRVGFFLQPLRC